LIFNFNILSEEKVNLVAAFGRSKIKIPSSFQKQWEKQKEINEK